MASTTDRDEVYLDWAASTPMRPEAVDAMAEAIAVGYGNPTGSHHRARLARRIVDDARDRVADALGAQPAQVIFCGSGTEADNLALFGARTDARPSVVCSAVEHHAVLNPTEHLNGSIVGVDARGALDLDQLATVVGAETAVVSVMLANNETGVVQPLEPIRAVLDEHAPDAALHTDAVQAFPWLDVAARGAPADLITISGHKFGGPKGVGVLVVRDSVRLAPQVLGGGQEFELRSGTHNVAGIAALGAAVEAMQKDRHDVVVRVGALRDRLIEGLRREIPDVLETAVDFPGGFAAAPNSGSGECQKVSGSAHVCFEGIESEALLFMLERAGLCASAASSCASGAQDPSHVLAAMGWPREVAAGSLRLSLGWGSTAADIDRALDVIPDCVAKLRAAAN